MTPSKPQCNKTTWVDKKGSQIPITQLSDQHLHNAIRCCWQLADWRFQAREQQIHKLLAATSDPDQQNSLQAELKALEKEPEKLLRQNTQDCLRALEAEQNNREAGVAVDKLLRSLFPERYLKRN